MKYGGKMLACLAGGLALRIAANEVSPDSSSNPYQSIVDRNVFALKPPPPPPDPEASKPPPVKITLTGITTLLGKRALLKSPAPPGKPGEPARPEISYILAPGQREGDIEILDIDEVGGNVKLRNGGVEVTLNIDKDGPKLTPTAAPVPGMPGAPGAIWPGGRAPNLPAPTANPGFTMPTRTLRLPAGGAGTAPAANPNGMSAPGAGYVPAANQGYSTTPNLPVGQQKTWPPEVNVSREEQLILMEAQRQQLLQEGNARAASLIPGTGISETSPGSQISGAGNSTPTLPRPPGSPPLPQ
jgi:hypothetical protein